MKDVLILAGGFGTRLRKLYPKTPKPLVPVCDEPILHHCILQCLKHGFKDILVSTHYEAEKIRRSIVDSFGSKCQLDFIHECEPRGTAGASYLALDSMSDDFFIIYADIYADVNMNKLMEFHHFNRSEFTTVVHPNDHPHDSDIILYDKKTLRIFAVDAHKSRKPNTILPNTVNAAMYVANKNALKQHPGCWDIAQDLIPTLVQNEVKVFAYETVEYLKDMGTPERLSQVDMDVISRKVSVRNDRSERIAVFLDRDGCINKYNGYIRDVGGFVLEANATEGIKTLNSSNYLTFCITNQPVIARGEATLEEVEKIHDYMATRLGLGGAYLDSVLLCPHHPDAGYQGEVEDLKFDCECRKPKPGMILELSRKHNIDLKNSWVVGDTMRDIAAGKSAGCWTILISGGDPNKNHKELSQPPDFVVNEVAEAAYFILNDFEILKMHAKDIIYDFFNRKKNKHILITGLSRSGKSTFASVLSGELARMGVVSHIFSTDYFLERSGKRHSREFNFAESISVLNPFSSVNITGLRNYFYIPEINTTVLCEPLNVNPNDIMIIEGENIPIDNIDADFYHIFLCVDEDLRYERFKSKYLSRGLPKREIDEIFFSRKNKELNTPIKIDWKLSL
ncbi:HAD-IIIA family hydrolase [Planktomarina temperata]|nr:HAD-IIIA family hydrolase [Planktomarina temperata]